MRHLTLTLALGLSLAAGSAAACRVGHSEYIVTQLSPVPEGPRFSTIALVYLEAHPYAESPITQPQGQKGYLVGSVRIREVVRGQALHRVLPAYLKFISSCSLFGWSTENRSGHGYVVGRLLVDERGQYLSLAERSSFRRTWH